jgi:hypothetical protein
LVKLGAAITPVDGDTAELADERFLKLTRRDPLEIAGTFDNVFLPAAAEGMATQNEAAVKTATKTLVKIR